MYCIHDVLRLRPQTANEVCLVFLLALVLFVVLFALNAVFAPLLLVILIPVGIGCLIYDRIKVHRRAEARLRSIMEDQAQLYNN